MAAAPEVVALPPLGVFLLTAVCIALIYAYKATLGAVINTLAHALDVGIPVIGHPFHFLVTGADALNSQVENALGLVVAANQRAWHTFVHWQAFIWQETSGALADLAEATASNLGWIRKHVLPSAISVVFGPLARLVYDARKQLAQLAIAISHLPHVIVHEVTRELVPVKTYVTKTTKIVVQTAAYTIPAAVGIPLPRIGRIERELHGIDETLKDVLRRVRAPALAAAAAAAIATLGLSWTRCSRVGKVGRSVCRMDDHLLESLLADALIVASTISIVQLARESHDFLKTVETPMISFVRELHNLPKLAPVNAAAALANYAAGRF